MLPGKTGGDGEGVRKKHLIKTMTKSSPNTRETHLAVREDKQTTQKRYLDTPLPNCWKQSRTGNLGSHQRQMAACVCTERADWGYRCSSDTGEAGKPCNIPLTCERRKHFTQSVTPLAAVSPVKSLGVSWPSSSHETSRTAEARHFSSLHASHRIHPQED